MSLPPNYTKYEILFQYRSGVQQARGERNGGTIVKKANTLWREGQGDIKQVCSLLYKAREYDER
jgi:hypothetical protein